MDDILLKKKSSLISDRAKRAFRQMASDGKMPGDEARYFATSTLNFEL